MANFGKYAILDDIVHNFKEEPTWWWKIKPPTSREELNLSKFLTKNRILYAPDGTRMDNPPTNLEVAIREIALSFNGTNIPISDDKPVEDGGKPFITPDDSIENIESALRNMPLAMLMEIWGAVGDAIPSWGPARPKPMMTDED